MIIIGVAIVLIREKMVKPLSLSCSRFTLATMLSQLLVTIGLIFLFSTSTPQTMSNFFLFASAHPKDFIRSTYCDRVREAM